MKKVLIAAAAAGLMSLAACTPPAANNTAEVSNDIANAEIYDLGNDIDNGVVENFADNSVVLNETGNTL